MVMIIKTATGLAFAAACLTTIATMPADAQTVVAVESPPRIDPGDVNWDPQRNVMEAQRYDRLVETNPAFRQARIRKECGPITDPQLRADCIASFDQYEPPVASSASSQRITSSTARHHQYVGSSTASRPQYHSQSGR
jgi:ABC-type transport system substrate-binding protein